MAVPKKRTSSRARDIRRSHLALKPRVDIEFCPDCGAIKQRHHACMECGRYRGRQVVAGTKRDE